jgi:Asp-tRNA(Asn)/Glu-tRNA(Gln) amidotransferase A subunit family amidase
VAVDIGELSTMDATAQAELVRRKELAPRELVDAAIARIEHVNPTLNAVITPLYEDARARCDGLVRHRWQRTGRVNEPSGSRNLRGQAIEAGGIAHDHL